MNRDLKPENGIPKPKNSLFNQKNTLTGVWNRKMGSQNPKLVILTGKEHDTPLFRDMQPENVFLRLENCVLPKKLLEIG